MVALNSKNKNNNVENDSNEMVDKMIEDVNQSLKSIPLHQIVVFITALFFSAGIITSFSTKSIYILTFTLVVGLVCFITFVLQIEKSFKTYINFSKIMSELKKNINIDSKNNSKNKENKKNKIKNESTLKYNSIFDGNMYSSDDNINNDTHNSVERKIPKKQNKTKSISIIDNNVVNNKANKEDDKSKPNIKRRRSTRILKKK